MTRRLRALVLAALFLSAGSCGLFETRDPVEPVEPPSGCRSLTSQSSAIFLNIIDLAVGYGRAAGRTCYSNMLDTTFTFHPDPQDSAQALPDLPFAGWDEVVEDVVNSNIAAAQDSILVEFDVDYANTIVSPDQTTETHFKTYRVFFSRKSGTDSSEVYRFTGLADLTLRRGVDGQWRITSWVDHRGGAADSTWGLLRREFRF